KQLPENGWLVRGVKESWQARAFGLPILGVKRIFKSRDSSSNRRCRGSVRFGACDAERHWVDVTGDGTTIHHESLKRRRATAAERVQDHVARLSKPIDPSLRK